MEINVKEARSKLSSLLDKVQAGGEITILRHGKKVARIVPPRSNGERLPPLDEFRASIRVTGEPLSHLVVRGKEEARY